MRFKQTASGLARTFEHIIGEHVRYILHATGNYVLITWRVVVGLTGGIASGKSTVSRLLSTKHKFPIVDADVIARDVVQPGTSAYARIVKQFGEDIVLRDGSLQIDRKKLGSVVFRDAEKRKVLNSIVHPAVRWAMLSAVLKLWMHGESVCILDVPLLVEANLWKMVGWVVIVYWCACYYFASIQI